MNPYAFLLDTYATERIKTLSVGSHFDDKDLGFRWLPGRSLYSTYGPTADTGGLLQQVAPLFYGYQSVESLLAAARDGNLEPASLPGPGTPPPTERPGRG